MQRNILLFLEINQRFAMHLRKIFTFLLASVVLLSAYGRGLDEIKRSGKIYIAFTSDDIRNINYPLAKEFASYLNVELVEVEIEWEEVFMKDGVIPPGLQTDPSVSFTPDALKKADIICSTFTILEWRKKLFDFAETLYSAELLLVQGGAEPPEEFQELAGKKITFQRSTTFEKHLHEINKQIGGGIELIATENGNQAKELFLNGTAYGIVLDADEALNFNAIHDHQFQIAFPVSDVTKTAWAVEKNNRLQQEVENFFETIANNGILDEIFYEKFEVQYSTFVDNIHKNLRYEELSRDLPGILASKKLVVALRDRSFIYRSDGQKQFMHALAEEFADHLGVSLEIIITPYFSKYWETGEGEVVRDSSYTPDWFNHFDIACEVFAPLEWRTKKVNMIPVYPSEYAVIAKKETEIKNLRDLQEMTCVIAPKTVYEDILSNNDLENYYFTDKVDNFLPEVASGNADYTILYNAFYELSKYPGMEVKLTLGDLNVCWGLRKDQPRLQAELEEFISTSSENGLIRVLMKSLQGNTLQTPDAYINSYYESFQTGQLPYVNYGADDGLPQEDVFSIFQDRKGYIWFGTNSGAVRYNGREMYVYNEKHGLPSNSVRDIKQDSTGTIFLATTNGVAEFGRDTVTTKWFDGISFKKILVDRRNNKWLIGEDGAYLLRPDGKEQYINSVFPELPNLIYNITEDPKTGSILLATSMGVFLVDLEKEVLNRISKQDAFSVFVDINDSIWISTKDGLYIADFDQLRKNSDAAQYYNLNERLDFPVEIFSEIKTNNYGSVWLISDNRIYQVISTDQAPVLYEQEIGIRNNKILSFLADMEDNIWIGFSGGLQRLTNRKGLRNFFPNTINSFIYNIFEDNTGRIWITSNNGIFYFKDVLTQYKPSIGVNNNTFLAARLNNGNILLSNTFGVYEVNVNTLQVVRFSQFPQLSLTPENIFVSASEEIFLLTGINGVVYYLEDFYSQPRQLKNRNTSNIYQLCEYQERILGGNNEEIVEFDGDQFISVMEADCNVWSLHPGDSILWVGTDCGIGRITDHRFENIEMTAYDKNVVVKTIVAAKNKNYLWVGTNRGFSYFNTNTREHEFRIDTKDGLSGDEITSGGLYLDKNDLLWIGTYHGISNFNIRAKSFRSYAPVCYIESLTLNGERIDPVSGKTYRHNQNNFVFEISALSFTDEKSVEYEFYLRGTGNNYTSYHRGDEFKAYYNNLPPGDYEFIYKAKGKNNLWGYAESFSFTIKKAWYQTWVFRLGLVIIIIILAYLFYKGRVRAIEQQKNKLEQLVKERTHELEEANVEIEAQRDIATAQRDKIAAQQKEIMDSIQYAQRIQESMLPSTKVLSAVLQDHFVLFKPRDIVSGDFYWAAEQHDHIYFTAADCTGHGVPGAFMSMLGIGFLNEIITKHEDIEPDEILNELRLYLISTLHQKGASGENKDGMDMVMCKYNRTTRILTYSAANNPFFHLSNGELNRIKGEAMPVAIHEKMDPFKPGTIEIKRGDIIYLFSDGYADQFGGPNSKKLMSKRFRQLIMEAYGKPMNEQRELLDREFEAWKGNIDQVDDVVVIGVRF